MGNKVQEVIKLTEQVPHYPGRTIEGLVLRFKMEVGGYHRTKVKSDDYKRCVPPPRSSSSRPDRGHGVRVPGLRGWNVA